LGSDGRYVRPCIYGERREQTRGERATERDFDVPFDGHGQKIVVVVVRGTLAVDDVLPYIRYSLWRSPIRFDCIEKRGMTAVLLEVP
jgi:hypothetical protein